MKNTYVCRKLFLYNFLTSKGFKPAGIYPDKFNPDKLVWLYEDTAELRDSVEEYYSVKRHSV